MRNLRFLLAVVLLKLGLLWAQQTPPVKPVNSDLLARRYREGEQVRYHMKAINQERGHTLRYEIQADGMVKTDHEEFLEEFAWSNLVVNGKAVQLSPASQNFRQRLCLEPTRNVLGIPDLSKLIR